MLLAFSDVLSKLNARGVKISPSRLRYALASRRIEPRQRAGVARLWSEEDLDVIERAVRQTQGTEAKG